MSANDEGLRQAIEGPFKIRLALGFLPPLPAPITGALEEWLAGAALPAQDAERIEARFDFATSADFRSITCRTSQSGAEGAQRLTERMEEVAGEEELALYDALLETLRPERVGDFIEARADALDRGWFFAMKAPLSRALAAVEPTPSVERLLEFAERHGLAECSRLQRSLGEGNPFTELVVPLPRGDAQKALEVGLAAYAALGVPGLDARLKEGLAKIGADELALSLWLTRGGVSKVGLLAPRPDTVQTLRLCAAVGATQMDPLAAVEGALGAGGPRTVECAITADGPKVELEYRL